MLHRVTLVRTDILEELSAFFIRVTRIGELGTTLAVTSNLRKLRHPDEGALSSFETSLLTRATRRNISEDAILHLELSGICFHFVRCQLKFQHWHYH
jgi:hypothetical protein